jgi:flagellar hook-associated protein 2
MVFTSNITGENNDLQIVNTNDNAELNALSTTDSAETAQYLTPIFTAQNAVATIDDIRVESATNKFENTIQNVRFDAKELSDLDSNGDPIPSRLSIGFDTEGLKENITAFVDKYNELMEEFGTLTRYGENDDDSDGALAGDSMVRGIQSGLSNILGNNVPNSVIGSLFALGIELTADGKLEIGATDFGLGSGSKRLDDALTDNFDDVANLFADTDGIATRLIAFTEEYTQSSGLLTSREDSIKGQQGNLETERERFELRMESLESTLRARYLSLDSTIASLQSTGNALFAAMRTG